jgi:hypothetical protein
VQAGKQLEHLSGGLIKAGFHEVVVNEATIQVLFKFGQALSFSATKPCVLDNRKSETGVPRPTTYPHLFYILLALVF